MRETLNAQNLSNEHL